MPPKSRNTPDPNSHAELERRLKKRGDKQPVNQRFYFPSEDELEPSQGSTEIDDSNYDIINVEELDEHDIEQQSQVPLGTGPSGSAARSHRPRSAPPPRDTLPHSSGQSGNYGDIGASHVQPPNVPGRAPPPATPPTNIPGEAPLHTPPNSQPVDHPSFPPPGLAQASAAMQKSMEDFKTDLAYASTSNDNFNIDGYTGNQENLPLDKLKRPSSGKRPSQWREKFGVTSGAGVEPVSGPAGEAKVGAGSFPLGQSSHQGPHPKKHRTGEPGVSKPTPANPTADATNTAADVINPNSVINQHSGVNLGALPGVSMPIEASNLILNQYWGGTTTVNYYNIFKNPEE